MSKPNRASRTTTARSTEATPPQGEHAYLWYFRNDSAIARLGAMLVNNLDKLPWRMLGAILVVSMVGQPGVELVERGTRRLVSAEAVAVETDVSKKLLRCSDSAAFKPSAVRDSLHRKLRAKNLEREGLCSATSKALQSPLKTLEKSDT
ncbi:hypothetical protein PV762_27215 [Mitsuaria sp. CC2]|uniref:hypothetical protein n=1 Tax=Mitsuaria sp. CC2 TaxID=3029186 RepID=UPI003B8AA6A0